MSGLFLDPGSRRILYRTCPRCRSPFDERTTSFISEQILCAETDVTPEILPERNGSFSASKNCEKANNKAIQLDKRNLRAALRLRRIAVYI